MSRVWLRQPFPGLLLAVPAFLSGASALVYEIVWTRRLALVLGSTAGAVAAVLSAFMLGLALGALLVGRRVDASRRPLRWYGFLEIGLGFYALAFDNLVTLAADLFPGIPWLTAFLLLVLPAALMGGTLPVLARAAADVPTRGARALGMLYAVNTFGAVFGALLAVFVLMPLWGLRTAVHAAAAVNLGIGVLSWLAARAAGDRAAAPVEGPPPPGVRRSAGSAVLLAFFLAGFAGLALQVAWIRSLVYLLEGFTIAFGLMLATYLLGLAAGAAGGTVLALASPNPRRLFSILLALEGCLAAATLLLLGPLSGWLEEARSTLGGADASGFRYAFTLFLASAAVLLPATLCAGALLPVVGRITIAHGEAIGRYSGTIYAASTLGAVLAPPCAAFFLVPGFGAQGTILIAGLLLVEAGALAAATLGRATVVRSAAASLLVLGLGVAAAPWRPLVEKSHVFRDARQPRRLLAHVEGRHFGIAVVEELGPRTRALYTDDFRAAETGPRYGYMRMLAHLPLLLHPDPQQVLVIAFGTGTTAGAASLHPEVKRLVCVELERSVYDVAPHFASVNRGVLGLPITQQVVADGREYVRRDGESFDIITLEPLMPYTPGAVYLYTKEFYASARERLKPGGLLCQWIPIHAVAVEDFRRLVRTVADSFAHVSLWYFEQSALVLGSASAPRVDAVRLAERAARPGLFEDLQEALVGDGLHLLAAHVASGDALRRALGDVAPMEDDHTVLEFRPLPRRFGRRSLRYQRENLEFLSLAHQREIPWLRDPPEGFAAAADATAAVLGGMESQSRALLEGGPLPAAREFEAVLAKDPGALHARAHAQRRLYRELLELGQPGAAAELEFVPDRCLALLALAEASSGEERRVYLTLALREDSLFHGAEGGEREGGDAARDRAVRLLRELAEGLAGAERRFVLNRVAALLRAPSEPGDEELPRTPRVELRPLLEAGEVARARAALREARLGGEADALEAEARAWLDAAADKSSAALLLDAVDSSHALRAALTLASGGSERDLIVIAPILCARSFPAWERLAQHAAPEVRDAAASAAATRGGARHLPRLATLCADRDPGVRLAAFTAFLALKPEAARAGYEPEAPSEAALTELKLLAGP